MNKLIFRSPTDATSGYKKLIETTFSLLKKEYELIFSPLTDNSSKNIILTSEEKLNKNNFHEQELIITPLYLDRYCSLSNVLPDKNNISVFTMWESTILPRFPVEELNSNAQKVIVPSKWCEDVFNYSGVKNVIYCPMFVDDDIFKYTAKSNNDYFSFSAGACNAHQTGNSKRKNFQIILNAFQKAFKGVKDVKINFKISSLDAQKIGKYLDERICFNCNYLTDIEVANFLSESDVFVSSSKAEGWGFFQIESLAIGRPVITANYGGVKDFCNEDNSFFVNYEEVLADSGWGKRGGLWAEIKEKSLIEQMRLCYENKDKIRNNFHNYSKSVLPRYSKNSFLQNIKTIL